MDPALKELIEATGFSGAAPAGLTPQAVLDVLSEGEWDLEPDGSLVGVDGGRGRRKLAHGVELFRLITPDWR